MERPPSLITPYSSLFITHNGWWSLPLSQARLVRPGPIAYSPHTASAIPTPSAGLSTNGLAAPISGLAITTRSFRARITDIHHNRIISIATTGSTEGPEVQRTRYAVKGHSSIFYVLARSLDHEQRSRLHRQQYTGPTGHFGRRHQFTFRTSVERLYVTHPTFVCYLLYVCRSPSGGWWTQPTNWKSNTAVAVGITATIVAAAWKYSAENEVFFPSHLFQEHFGYMQKSKNSVDTHRKEGPRQSSRLR